MLMKIRNILTIALHIITYALPIINKHIKNKSDTNNK